MTLATTCSITPPLVSAMKTIGMNLQNNRAIVYASWPSKPRKRCKTSRSKSPRSLLCSHSYSETSRPWRGMRSQSRWQGCHWNAGSISVTRCSPLTLASMEQPRTDVQLLTPAVISIAAHGFPIREAAVQLTPSKQWKTSNVNWLVWNTMVSTLRE